MRMYIYCWLLLFSQMAYAQGGQEPYVQVLGVAQDGGYPHMGCHKQCCTQAWKNDSLKKWVVSLAVVDPEHKKWWLFEATPDIKDQLHYFEELTHGQYNYLPEGIFVTHAHIGHYTGLMELGREVMSTKAMPVYSLSKMAEFLENNGPWSQLIQLNNIALMPMRANAAIRLSESISVTAFTVPHRDEYSETAGFKINTENKKFLFIPDINKWDKWSRSIADEVKAVDVALLDATFYDANELPGRNMSEVPHPFVSETMELFKKEDAETKAKIHFIHFNHTNPVLWDAEKRKEIKKEGFNIAVQGERL